MCTERCRRALALAVALLLGGSGPAAADGDPNRIGSWLRDGDPVVLLLQVDGLRPDRLEAEAPWDGPLMPHASDLAARAWVFEEVWAELGDPVHSFRQLLLGGPPRPTPSGRRNRGFGALVEAGYRTRAVTAPMDLRAEAKLPPWAVRALDPVAPAGDGRCAQDKNPRWLERQEEAVLAALEEAAGDEGPTLVVASVDHLLAPRRVPSEILRELDPEPWATPPASPVRIELHVEKRLRPLLDRARSTATPRLDGNERALQEHAWLVDAAHRRFDRFLGRLLERLGDPELESRCLLILTAAAATPLGRHGVGEVGHGAQVDGLHVPLWIRFPPGWDEAGRDRQPRRLRELADSMESWVTGRTSPAPLYEVPSPSRSHLALGWGRLHVGARLEPLVELRWTTPDFTLLERRQPRSRLSAFDRRVDPGEFVDRYVEIAAAGDSLRSELRRRLFGDEVRLRLDARGLAGRTLVCETTAAAAALEILDADGPTPLPTPGGSRMRWTVPPGEEAVLRLVLPGDACDFRLGLEGGPTVPLHLGSGRATWDAGRSVAVLAGDEKFFRMLAGPSADPGPGLHLSLECGGWLQSED